MSQHPCGPRKKRKKRNRPQTAASQENDHAPREMAVATPPSPANSAQAEECQGAAVPWWKQWDNGWKRVIDTIAIVFAIGYAIVTYLQWHDLRNNYRADERSWMVPDVKPLPEFTDDIPLTLTNSGKSVVISSRMLTWVEILDHDATPSLAYDWARAWDDRSNLMVPGRNYPTFTRRVKKDGSDAAPATGNEIKALNDGYDYLVIYGFINYTDNFGPHWTKFCEWEGFKQPPPEINGKAITYNAGSCTQYRAVGEGNIFIPSKP